MKNCLNNIEYISVFTLSNLVVWHHEKSHASKKQTQVGCLVRLSIAQLHLDKSETKSRWKVWTHVWPSGVTQRVNRSWKWGYNGLTSLDHRMLFHFPHEQPMSWINWLFPSLYPPVAQWQVHGEDIVLLSHTCGTEGSAASSVKQ